MGILEIVFNSRKFDLNDDVLMGFDNYFDKKSKDYNSFCLDEDQHVQEVTGYILYLCHFRIGGWQNYDDMHERKHDG